MLVSSATARLAEGYQPFLVRHLVAIAAGVVVGGVAACLRPWLLRPAVIGGYGLSILLLLAVIPLGTTVSGAHSWIRLGGGFSLQPSEAAKLAIIATIALWFAERQHLRVDRGTRTGDYWGALAIAGLPLVLVLVQPDVGTVLVMCVTVALVLLQAQASWRLLVGLALLGATATVLVVHAGLVAQYQLDRFTAFLRPDADPLGVGYNTEQSILAIGHGGMTGQGLFHGVATQGGYVPEQRADFVFSVAGEELGFVGAAGLIVALGVVVWRMLSTAARCVEPFDRLVCVGVASWFAVQGFENIGMSMRLVPVTGVPLPMVSYGGSSMIACLLAVGLVIGARSRALSGQPFGSG
jgi:rod shape determining protein RodA